MKYLFLVLVLASFFLPFSAFADLAVPTIETPAFVSLTNIPALEGAGNADTLPAFVNSLYKIAIGLAAVLAVLQIIRAGIMYMGGDSVTEKKEAKNLIALSIGGLVLILSPVVVFSIINPKILDLKIGGLDELTATTFTTYESGGGVVSGDGTTNTCGTYVSVVTVAQATACSTKGAGYEDVVGTCTMCRPAAGSKCCGTKSIANAQFGWKAWYTVPKAGGGTESKQYRSTGTFSTSALCLASVRGAGTTLPTGAVYDGSAGKGTTCACAAELRLQGAACTPWTSTPGGTDGPTTLPGTNTNQPLASRFYVYRPITGSPAPRGPVPASKTAYDSYVSSCKAKPGTTNDDYGNSEDCTAAELEAWTGSAGAKPYIKCMPVTVSCVSM